MPEVKYVKLEPGLTTSKPMPTMEDLENIREAIRMVDKYAASIQKDSIDYYRKSMESDKFLQTRAETNSESIKKEAKALYLLAEELDSMKSELKSLSIGCIILTIACAVSLLGVILLW